MQKNKFFHADLEAVCNSAAKKLTTLAMVAAVGSTSFVGSDCKFTAIAQMDNNSDGAENKRADETDPNNEDATALVASAAPTEDDDDDDALHTPAASTEDADDDSLHGNAGLAGTDENANFDSRLNNELDRLHQTVRNYHAVRDRDHFADAVRQYRCPVQNVGSGTGGKHCLSPTAPMPSATPSAPTAVSTHGGWRFVSSDGEIVYCPSRDARCQPSPDDERAAAEARDYFRARHEAEVEAVIARVAREIAERGASHQRSARERAKHSAFECVTVDMERRDIWCEAKHYWEELEAVDAGVPMINVYAAVRLSREPGGLSGELEPPGSVDESGSQFDGSATNPNNDDDDALHTPAAPAADHDDTSEASAPAGDDADENEASTATGDDDDDAADENEPLNPRRTVVQGSILRLPNGTNLEIGATGLETAENLRHALPDDVRDNLIFRFMPPSSK